MPCEDPIAEADVNDGDCGAADDACVSDGKGKGGSGRGKSDGHLLPQPGQWTEAGIRMFIAERVIENWKDLQHFSEELVTAHNNGAGKLGLSFLCLQDHTQEVYRVRMEQPEAWGGHLELMLLSNWIKESTGFNVTICVWQNDAGL